MAKAKSTSKRKSKVIKSLSKSQMKKISGGAGSCSSGFTCCSLSTAVPDGCTRATAHPQL